VQAPTPALVVDLGSGTGLSTAVWAEQARRVIGLEPLAAFRREAARTAGGTTRASPSSPVAASGP
jgi:protein-L-isoaspartate O-methyltransferase